MDEREHSDMPSIGVVCALLVSLTVMLTVVAVSAWATATAATQSPWALLYTLPVDLVVLAGLRVLWRKGQQS